MRGAAGEGHLQAGLAPIPPRFRGWVLALVHGLLPVLLRLRLVPWLPAGIERVEVRGGIPLAEAFRRFQAGEIRLILAFRHSAVDDPLCALQLLARELPRVARGQGIPLRLPLHTQFLYDRGMPLWGGPGLGWLLSRLGGIALRRGKQPDWSALRQARALVLDGPFPLAVAPEGATNGHGGWIGPLEPGVAQLGVWGVADLQRCGRSEDVWIVPIAIHYTYPRPPWGRLDRLMAQLERVMGLPPPPADQPRYGRLRRLGETLLAALEEFHGINAEAGVPLERRIDHLRQEALRQAEAPFGLAAAGTPERRCRRIEEAAWQRIHRDDLPPRRRLAPLQRALADRLAREATLALQRMRIVETLVAVSGHYVADRPCFERYAETTLLLAAALAHLQGQAQTWLPRLGWRRALLTVAEPLRLGEREGLAAEEKGPTEVRRQRERTHIAQLTAAIEAAFSASLP